MDTKERNFFSPSKLKPTIVYIAVIFIGTTFLTMLFSMLAGSIRGLDSNTIANSYFQDIEITEEMKECKLIGSCYGTAVGYFISLLAIVLWMRNDFIADFEMLREKKKFYLIYIPIAAVAFAILAILLDMLFSNFAGDSSNQSSIEAMLHSKGAVPMIMSTVLFAPIVEEMIYRKAIFSVMKEFPVAIPYVTSTILFALPHMLSTSISSVGFGIWILQLLPYLICGALLCLVYHQSKYNVYASIAAHLLNNLLAVILVFF